MNEPRSGMLVLAASLLFAMGVGLNVYGYWLLHTRHDATKASVSKTATAQFDDMLVTEQIDADFAGDPVKKIVDRKEHVVCWAILADRGSPSSTVPNSVAVAISCLPQQGADR